MGDLKFVDSFEHYGTADVRSKWTQGFDNFGVVISGGRNGKGFQVNAGGAVGKTIDNFYSTWIISFAFKCTGETFANQLLSDLRSTGSSIATIQVNADATLSIRCNGNTRIVDTSTFSLHPNIWYYMEWKTTISGSSDLQVDSILKIDGDIKAQGTHATGINQDTLIYPHAAANNFVCDNASGNGATIIDDVYILASSDPDLDFRGDLAVLAIYPDGDTGENNWTPVGGSGDHFERINEHAPDEDTTYLESDTDGQAENFDWEDVPGTVGVIKGYQYSVRARKDNEGFRVIRQTQGDSAAAPDQETDDIYINDSYLYYTYPIDDELSPSDFNARKHGFKVIVPA